MVLFLKLILAHLIADFILQFDKLYQLKVKSRVGHVFHAAIHGLTSLLLALPYLRDPRVWGLILTLAVIHYFQDLLKYHLQKERPQSTCIFFSVDQVFHVLFISSVFLFPMARHPPDFSRFPRLVFFYTENFWTLLAIVFVTATFAGSYFLHNLGKNYFKDPRPDQYITPFEISHGILERTWIMGIFLFADPIFFALAPAVGILRLPKKILKSWRDFILSFIYAASLGLLFRSFL